MTEIFRNSTLGVALEDILDEFFLVNFPFLFSQLFLRNLKYFFSKRIIKFQQNNEK